MSEVFLLMRKVELYLSVSPVCRSITYISSLAIVHKAVSVAVSEQTDPWAEDVFKKGTPNPRAGTLRIATLPTDDACVIPAVP